MKNYKYILWDLDGTMINSYEGVSKCLIYAFEAFGVKVDGKEIGPDTDYRKFIGPPFRDSFLKYTDITEENLEAVIEKYRERYKPIGAFECELFPGVREIVKRIHEAGKLQVLASSKPEAQCRDILKKFDLIDLFDEAVGSTPDGSIDSKIEVLNEAFRRLKELDPDFNKDEAVLLGDTHFDVDGARQAGIDCLGVTYGFGTREELIEAGALEVFDSEEELLAAIMNE